MHPIRTKSRFYSYICTRDLAMLQICTSSWTIACFSLIAPWSRAMEIMQQPVSYWAPIMHHLCIKTINVILYFHTLPRSLIFCQKKQINCDNFLYLMALLKSIVTKTFCSLCFIKCLFYIQTLGFGSRRKLKLRQIFKNQIVPCFKCNLRINLN